MAKRFYPPEAVKANVRRALDASARRLGQGLTDFQISRAMDIVGDFGITLDQVKGMFSYLNPILPTFDIRDKSDRRWLGVLAAGGPSAMPWIRDVIERELESDFL